MASQLPCKKNDSSGFVFYGSLASKADPTAMQANPTFAAGDVKIALDDGAPVNINTLPVVDADFTKRIKIVLNQAETNADNITIIFSDAAGAEWCDLTVNLQTVATRFDDIAMAVWNVLTSALTTASSIGKKLADWVLGSDSKVLISTNAQDLSTSLDVRTKAIASGIIASGSFAASAITSTVLANNAITSGKLASGCITNSQIAADAIGTSQFAQAAADKVWLSAARSLTTFGTLVSDVASAVWAALTSGMATVGSIGKKLADWVLGTDNKNLISTDAQDLSTTLDVRTKALADDIITAAIFDESTAFPLKSADAGSSAIARVGADGDTLETLSDQLDGAATAGALSTVDTVVDAIKAKTDNLPTDPAGVSNLSGLAASADLATVDTVVDAVKAVTDKLDTALELDGGVYRYTENALEQAPGGAGGGSTAQEIWEYPVDGALTAQAALVNINTKIDALAPTAGTYTVDLVSRQADLTRIPGVLIAIKNDSGQTIRTLTTDSNGDAQITLDAGSFTAVAFKAMVNFDDTAFTITGNATVNIEGTVISPTAPATGTQTVYFMPDDPALTLDTGATVYAEAAIPNQAGSGDVIFSSKRIAASRVNDHFEMQLAKGGQFRIIGISGDAKFFQKIVTVTDDDTRSLKDYLA